MSTRVAVVCSSFLLLAVVGLTGCVASPSTPAAHVAAPKPIVSAHASAETRAHAEAVALLRTAILPAGSHDSGVIVRSALSGPIESLGCTPLVDVSRFAIVPDSNLRAVLAQLSSDPAVKRVAGLGTVTQNGRLLSAGGIEGGSATGILTIELDPVSGGSVGVRVDAQVVPDGASCARFGPETAVTTTAT